MCVCVCVGRTSFGDEDEVESFALTRRVAVKHDDGGRRGRGGLKARLHGATVPTYPSIRLTTTVPYLHEHHAHNRGRQTMKVQTFGKG